MKVLSDILHKAGIIKEAPENYSSGGYSLLVRNSTTGRLENISSSSTLPDQTGNAGKYLTTDGTNASWATINLAGYVPTSRTITINGTTFDLTENRSWSVLESDTLDSVSDRGSVTTNILTIGGIYSNTAPNAVFTSDSNYFYQDRIASSGTQGFKIKRYGTDVSFWRYDDGTGFVEFGNAQNYALKLYTNNTAQVYVHPSGNTSFGNDVDGGYRIDATGQIRASSRVVSGLGGFVNNCLYTYISNHCGSSGYLGFGFVNTVNPSAADSVFDIYQGNVADPVANLFNIKHSLLNASYGVSQSILGINTIINQSGTATGDIRGIFYNPTVTNVIGNHYAWESTSGKFKISDLAGTGDRMVVASSSGVLSTQALPTSTNIYNANGSLTANRTVTMSGRSLTFSGSSTSTVITSTGKLLVGGATEAAFYNASINGSAYISFYLNVGNTVETVSLIASASTQTYASAVSGYSEYTLLAAAPSIPSAGLGRVYAKTDKKIYWRDSDGVEYDLTASGSVTSVALATGTTGTDVNISGSPITSSGTITINIPSASTTARGLITTSTQTIAGTKTFSGNRTNINGLLDLGNYIQMQELTIASGSPDPGKGFIWLNSATSTLYFRNDLNVDYDLTASGSVTSVALATGTTGTDVNVSGSPITGSGTITLNIPDASASARGLVNTTTQTFVGLKSFDNIIIKGSSTTGPGTNYVRINNISDNGGHLAIQSAVSGYSYAGAGYISILSTQADYLSISYQTNVKIANFIGSGLTAVRNYTLPDASGTISLGTGTTNYIPKWTSTNALGSSLIYDNGTNVLIGSTTSVQGALQVTQNGGGVLIRTDNSNFGLGIVNTGSSNKTWDLTPFGNRLAFNESNVGTVMTLHPGGNISIGDINDAGYKLDINGTFRVTGASQFEGNVTITDADNIVLGTTTGTKIGTATGQKISLWNATPIVQPTTAISEAAFVENSGGTAVNVDSTFAGYTIQQIAQALKDFGLLA